MNDADAFQVAWAVHESAERFRRAMHDLETAPGVTAEQCAEIAVGLLQMADNTKSTDVEDDNAGQQYADKATAPLSPETIAALRAQLESGEYARYRSPRRGEQEK